MGTAQISIIGLTREVEDVAEIATQEFEINIQWMMQSYADKHSCQHYGAESK